MKVNKTNNVQIQGQCTNFPDDIYNMEIRENNMYIGIDDADYDVITSVIIPPKDAIHIAEQILNFYKGRKLSNENN